MVRTEVLLIVHGITRMGPLLGPPSGAEQMQRVRHRADESHVGGSASQQPP